MSNVTNDPISDMLTRVRNAMMVRSLTVSIPKSNIKIEIARILKEEGYIEDYQVIPESPRPVLRLKLKYVGDRRHRKPVISGIKRVSKPGRRVYVSKDEIPWVLSGMGVAILTTSKGVITGQEARRFGVGGELLCEVW